MKAAVIEPSAKSRRRKFGRVKATREGVREPARAHEGRLGHLADEPEDARSHREEGELAALAHHAALRFVGHGRRGYGKC